MTEPDGSKHGFRPRLTDAERRKNAEVLWKVALRERATARLLADAARSEAVAHDLALAAQDAALAAQDGPK